MSIAGFKRLLRKVSDPTWTPPAVILQPKTTKYAGKPSHITPHQWMKHRAVEYLGAFCWECGVEFPDREEVYQFDHLGDKDIHLARMFNTNRSWEDIKLELDKCALVCANCHATRTKRLILAKKHHWLNTSLPLAERWKLRCQQLFSVPSQ